MEAERDEEALMLLFFYRGKLKPGTCGSFDFGCLRLEEAAKGTCAGLPKIVVKDLCWLVVACESKGGEVRSKYRHYL